MKRQIKRWLKRWQAPPPPKLTSRDRGDEARNVRDWSAAAKFYREHLEHHAEDFAIWVQLGHSLKELHQYDDAAKAYSSAGDINPEDADLLLNRGHLEKIRGNHAEATRFYQLSLASDPSGPAVSEIGNLDAQAAAKHGSRGYAKLLLAPAATARQPQRSTAHAEDFRLYAVGEAKALTVGSTVLGTVEPGADALQATIRALADMTLLAPELASQAVRLGHNPIGPPTPTGPAARPYDVGACGLAVEDCWFVNDAMIRWRINRPASEASDPLVIRFHQPCASQAGALAPVGEASVLPESMSFIDTPLLSALRPILITVSSAHGALQGASLAPFPTLLRGGAHHAELYATGTALPDHANLVRVSRDLLAQWRQSAGAAPLSLSHLAIDFQNATGAERIFAPPMVEWLTEIMGLRLSAVMDRADSTLAYLAAYLDSHADRSNAVVRVGAEMTLSLPADALPTLSALVSRRLAGSATNGSYLTADIHNGRPRWAVSMPPQQGDLSSLQPRRGVQGLPVLTRGTSRRVDPAIAAPPLAIRFLDSSPARPAALLMPSAPDSDLPVLRKRMTTRERMAASVTVVTLLRSPSSELAAFTHALAAQTGIGPIELLVGVKQPDGSEERSAIDAAIQAILPGRSLFTDDADDVSALNQLVSEASGKFILIADENVILHDRRLLETLCTLMTRRGVASAGCVLIDEQRTADGCDVQFRSAGVHPSHVSFRSGPALAFHEPKSLGALPNSTYPVVANTSRLCLVSQSAWRSVGALTPGSLSIADAMLDWSLRAIAADRTHLCTSAVSAADVTHGRAPQAYDTIGLSQVTTQRWQETLNASCTLRALQ